MKLIEKKCPNCGAGLKFGKDDTEVMCEYCKKSYVIQRDSAEIDKQVDVDDGVDRAIVAEYYNLVQKRADGVKAVAYIILVIFFFIFILAISGILEFSRNSQKYIENKNSEVNVIRENYVEKFDEIDEKSLEIIHKETLKKLSNQNDFVSSDVVKSEWTYVGMYLLTNKDDHSLIDVNVLYDVYKKSYVGKNVEMEVYATVRYEDLKLSDEGKVISSFSGYTHAPMLFINGGTSSFVSGYESNEDLFNKVIRSKSADYNIISTSDMYMEN